MAVRIIPACALSASSDLISFFPHLVFHQSSPAFNSSSPYDPLKHSFGLVDTSEERWSRFQTEIDKLNEGSDKHTSYKVFFVARHGQGWHNVSSVPPAETLNTLRREAEFTRNASCEISSEGSGVEVRYRRME